MNFRSPQNGRTYLFIGAGLFLLSLPLLAFQTSHFQNHIRGYEAWILSFYVLLPIEPGLNLFFAGMSIAALWNIALLIFPLIPKAKAGTSVFTCWSFTLVALVVIPALGIYLQMGESHYATVFREGYFLYIAAYCVSAYGFWKKREERRGENAKLKM